MEKPVVWRMVKEAIEALGGSADYSQIQHYIIEKWIDVNRATIEKQIIAVTVNHKSRVYYAESNKPRLTNTGSNYDFLFRVGHGRVVSYEPEKHGIWEVYVDEHGKPAIRQHSEGIATPTYLFVWNPKNWAFATLNEKIEQRQQSGTVTMKWSCISHKKVRPGDRAFLLKLGTEPKGIFGSGYVVSEPFLSPHWSGEDKDVYRVMIEFEVLVNPDSDPILPLDDLMKGDLRRQQWLAQSSGISIAPELIPQLEALWFKFLTQNNILQEDIDRSSSKIGKKYMEGGAVDVTQTRYERNPHARNECLKHYGYICSVCDFDFNEIYGDIGHEFIHVHHLTMVSSVGTKYEIDPIRDLRPVCPNCHAMIHRRKEPYSIEDLKDRINRDKS